MSSDSAMDHRLERLVFFSDAVFAIAITLLVIEIHVPSLEPGTSSAAAARELVHLLPSFVAFIISFFVIGRFWIGHHTLFSHVRRFDTRLIWPNLCFLFWIAAMPFATAFLGRNFGQFVPAIFYTMTMLSCALFNLWLTRTTRTAGLLDDTPEAATFRHRPHAVVGGAVVCVALVFVSPYVAPFGMMTIPLWLRLFNRRSAA